MSDQISEIRNAIDTFDIAHARELLRVALKKGATGEIYYLAAQVAINEAQRVNFLQKAIELDPFHQDATAELTKLQASEDSKTQTSSTSISKNQIETTPQQELEEPNFVTGRVVSVTTLWNIPSEEGTRVAELPQYTSVILLARDDKLEWLNVLYNGSAGQDLIGWVRATYVENLGLSGNSVLALDLPITQFKYNTRTDIQKLANIKFSVIQAQTSQGARHPLLVLLGGGIAWIGGILLFANLDPGKGVALMIGLMLVGVIAVFSGAIWYGILIVQNQKKTKYLREEWQYLRDLARTEQDKQMIQQVKLAAINTALQVGGNVVTRSTPDRQIITQRYH